MSTKSKFNAGFVAIVGQPNAGKSTLLNALLQEKVSIVSPKPQTTRGRVTGILNMPNAQIVLVDAPGSVRSTSGINQFLQDEIKDVLAKSDVICVLLASDNDEKPVKELIEAVRKSGKKWFAVITKIDLMGAGTRTPKFFKYLMDEEIPFVSISTLKRGNEAREEVLNRILPLLPESAGPLFDEELYTTQTMRQMAAEFVREACFDNLHQELPYGLAVRIMDFKEDEPTVLVRAEIVVEKENHKGIVIGKGGQTLKKIGMEARKEIERVVGSKIFLELHVSVHENWTRNKRVMKELGYVIKD